MVEMAKAIAEVKMVGRVLAVGKLEAEVTRSPSI
jgi:hypothetical protein